MVPAGPDLSRCLRVAWGAPEADVSSASAATGGRQRRLAMIGAWQRVVAIAYFVDVMYFVPL